MSKRRAIKVVNVGNGRAKVTIRCPRCGEPQIHKMALDDAIPEPVPSIMQKLCDVCEDDHFSDHTVMGV